MPEIRRNAPFMAIFAAIALAIVAVAFAMFVVLSGWGM